MVQALADAQAHTRHVLNIQYPVLIAMFPQMWGSTALGFGGMGGAAMTTAYTIVMGTDYSRLYSVYFNGRYAYCAELTNAFVADLRDHHLKARDKGSDCVADYMIDKDAQGGPSARFEGDAIDSALGNANFMQSICTMM